MTTARIAWPPFYPANYPFGWDSQSRPAVQGWNEAGVLVRVPPGRYEVVDTFADERGEVVVLDVPLLGAVAVDPSDVAP